MVVIGVGRGQQFLGKRFRSRQNFVGIAVVEPEDRRAPLGLDANTRERELTLCIMSVDRLRIVV